MILKVCPAQRAHAGGASGFGDWSGRPAATPYKQPRHRVRSPKAPPLKAQNAEGQSRIDPRLAFLACAAARFDLVEAGAMTLDEALDDDFVERFRAIAGIVCRCEREILDRWERSP